MCKSFLIFKFNFQFSFKAVFKRAEDLNKNYDKIMSVKTPKKRHRLTATGLLRIPFGLRLTPIETKQMM